MSPILSFPRRSRLRSGCLPRWPAPLSSPASGSQDLGRPLGLIAPAALRQPYAENIDHVTRVSAEQRQAAVAIVPPADRYLLDAITQAPRYRQNLHVEHLSVDTLPAENLAGRLAREKLEAALRVGDALQAHHGVHEHPETLAPDLPEERLPLLDLRLPHGPRPDHHVIAPAEAGPHFIELFDG